MEKLLSKERKLDAQQVITLDMSAIKIDMRLISKVASGGDILVRSDGGLAAFDYNSGTFAYQPIAKAAEEVISQVNELYFYTMRGEGGPEKTASEISVANSMFTNWLNQAKMSLP